MIDRYHLELTEGELIIVRKLVAAVRKGEPYGSVRLHYQRRAFNSLERKLTTVVKVRAEPALSLTPPDPERCQADKPGNGPFTIGGEIGDPKNGYRTRCRSKPEVIAVEVKPGGDGQRGSMALCGPCKAAMIKERGQGFAAYTPISEDAS